MKILVDSNVLIDIFTEDPNWFEWSARKLAFHSESDLFVINPIIYAEVSLRFSKIEDLELALPASTYERQPLPWEAAFSAGKCFLEYKRRGGSRSSPLPDFYIGAHAAISGMAVLTRDPKGFRTYFPTLRLISP